jgi:hypothetical protein
LFQAGLVVNPYNPLPSLGGPGIRFGVNEPTRLGLVGTDFVTVAEWIADIVLHERPVEEISPRVAELRRQHRPEFCFQDEAFEAKLNELGAAFEDDRRRLFPSLKKSVAAAGVGPK